jgi:hypothetical protein
MAKSFQTQFGAALAFDFSVFSIFSPLPTYFQSHLNVNLTNTFSTFGACQNMFQVYHKDRLPAAVTRQDHGPKQHLGPRRQDGTSLSLGALQILINRRPSGQR